MKNKSILITGGTGSFGKHFISYVSKKHKSNRIVIYSRDELKQSEMMEQYPKKKFPHLRFFLGDVRDKDRLDRAVQNVDIIVHAAALKQVEASEYNSFEFIKTNIIGAQNIVEVAIKNKVKRIVALSTDKAAAPTNLYGATKLCSDKIFSSANNYSGKSSAIFSVVRYGNVMFSRGSVIPLFLKLNKSEKLFPITDKRMTRFNISLEESVDMVLWGILNAKGGEIFVPKIPSYRILDLAKAINPNKKFKIIGIRPGEKIHEELITSSDSQMTYDLGKYFAILNPANARVMKYYSSKKFKKFPYGESYNSENNNKFLSNLELKKILKKQILTT
jgi:UDP-N-acetylglucosamine 4,6-dehydratase